MKYLPYILKHLRRNWIRTSSTVLGMAVCIFLFCTLQTILTAIDFSLQSASAQRLWTRHAVSLVFPIPLSYKARIASVAGVRNVANATWFQGVYVDRKNFFANFAVEPRSFLDLYPEFVLPEDQRSAFLKDRRGCVAGRGLAERFGWKVGDTVPLQGTIYPGDWPMTLRGVYQGRDKSTVENQLFFHWDYLNERLKERFPRRANQAGIFVIVIAHAEEAPAVAGAVDAVFKNSLAETLTETERAFQLGFVTMSEAILAAIRLVSLIIIGIIMAVVANTMIMSVRERMHEFAVFKTLGYGAFHLAGLILGESLVICAAGGALGIAGTFPALRILAGYVGNIFPVLDITPATLGLDVLAAVLVALVAAAFPIRKVITVRIVDALGRVG